MIFNSYSMAHQSTSRKIIIVISKTSKAPLGATAQCTNLITSTELITEHKLPNGLNQNF